MVYDVVIVMIIGLAAFVGWQVGIINSWRSPLSIVVATIATQKFYIDAATVLVGHMRASPQQAVATAYVIMWPLFLLIAETILRVVLPFSSKTRPMFFSRLLGAVWGCLVGLLIVMLPALASSAQINIPPAAQDKAHLVQPLGTNIETSTLVPPITRLSTGLLKDLAKYAISAEGPSFKPDYEIDDQQSQQ